MRVRIAYTVDVPDWYRREINEWFGRPGLATRDEVKRWFEMYGFSQDDDVARRAGLEDDEVLDGAWSPGRY